MDGGEFTQGQVHGDDIHRAGLELFYCVIISCMNQTCSSP